MTRRMRTSRTGTDLIRSFEGFRPHAVRLTDGRFLIGHGHTKSAREGAVISQEDALLLLKEYDLPPIERALSEWVLSPLNQNEFDALVSFAFNIGLREFRDCAVLAHLNAGESLAAADAMLAWRKARLDGRMIVVDALVRRRAAEMALFLEHPGGRPAAPGVLIRPRLDLTVGLGSARERAPGPQAPAPTLTPLPETADPAGPPVSPPATARASLSAEAARELSERIARIADRAGEPASQREAVVPAAKASPEAPDDSLDAVARAIRELAEPPDAKLRAQAGSAARAPVPASSEMPATPSRPMPNPPTGTSASDLPPPEHAFDALAREHARSTRVAPARTRPGWRRHVGAMATIATGLAFLIWGLLDRLLYLPPAFTLSMSDFDPLPPLAVIGGVVTIALGVWSLLRGWFGTGGEI